MLGDEGDAIYLFINNDLMSFGVYHFDICCIWIQDDAQEAYNAAGAAATA